MTNQSHHENLTLPITTIIAVIVEQLKNLPTSDHPDKPGHSAHLAIMARTTKQLTRPNQTLEDLKTISKIVTEQRRAESRFHQRPAAARKTAENKPRPTRQNPKPQPTGHRLDPTNDPHYQLEWPLRFTHPG